jgi:hypothetical protein
MPDIYPVSISTSIEVILKPGNVLREMVPYPHPEGLLGDRLADVKGFVLLGGIGQHFKHYQYCFPAYII